MNGYADIVFEAFYDVLRRRRSDPDKPAARLRAEGAFCRILGEEKKSARTLIIYLPQIKKFIQLPLYKQVEIGTLENFTNSVNFSDSKFFRSGKLISSDTLLKTISKDSAIPLVWPDADASVSKTGLQSFFTEYSNPVWDEAVVGEGIPYLIDEVIAKKFPQLLKNIKAGISCFQERTILRFHELKKGSDLSIQLAWIKFYASDLICSSVGRGVGESPICLTSEAPVFAILHEMMHTLGFVHEHQRADRDLYVEVSEKMKSGQDYLKKSEFFAIGNYDPKSIMHYHYIPGEIKPKLSSPMTSKEKAILSKADFPIDFSEGDIESLHVVYGKELVCTFSKTGRDYTNQGFYECETCWGINSQAGCCVSCRFICHKGHQVIYHQPGKDTFFCDCGLNEHNLKCTRISSGTSKINQPLYDCVTCKKGPLCYPCSANRAACLTQHTTHSVVLSKTRYGCCSCECSLTQNKKTKSEFYNKPGKYLIDLKNITERSFV